MSFPEQVIYFTGALAFAVLGVSAIRNHPMSHSQGVRKCRRCGKEAYWWEITHSYDGTCYECFRERFTGADSGNQRPKW